MHLRPTNEGRAMASVALPSLVGLRYGERVGATLAVAPTLSPHADVRCDAC
jgi:hypothetical protein